MGSTTTKFKTFSANHKVEPMITSYGVHYGFRLGKSNIGFNHFGYIGYMLDDISSK